MIEIALEYIKFEGEVKMKILLIADVQQGFINEFTKHIPVEIDKHVKNFQYDLVVATRFINKSGSLFQSELGMQAMTMLSQETKLVATIGKIADIVLLKSTYSSITADLIKLLEKKQVEAVYLAGMNTETCILATALELFDKDIKPKILSGLCMSQKGPEVNRQAIELLRNAIGSPNIL
ncbi:MAG: cysteine hydrolase [Clostridia bacterium]|nr:cysteine hydrolase [Clostridia bacterium]